MRRCCLNFLFCALISTLASQVVAAKQFYRWIDENGDVYYSDRVPTQHSKHRREKLNNRGAVVSVVEGARSQKQIKQDRLVASLRAEQTRLLKEQSASDGSLLRTFRNTDEIVSAMENKLTTLDILTKVTKTNIGRLDSVLDILRKRAAKLERAGKKVPKKLSANIETTRKQIRDNYRKIKHHEADKIRVRGKFETDIARFEELTDHQKSRRTGLTSSANLTENEILKGRVLSLVSCETDSICDQIWRLARSYVQEHATTRLRIYTDSLIHTADPLREKDISLTVSKIINRSGDGARVFLDVRCKQSSVGLAMCRSSKVGNILAGFRPYLDIGLTSK